MTSENPSMPWSLIGVSEEARRIVRDEAAKHDQTIGQWLNERILTAAQSRQTRHGSDEPDTARTPGAILARIEHTVSVAEEAANSSLSEVEMALSELAIRLENLEAAENRAQRPRESD